MQFDDVVTTSLADNMTGVNGTFSDSSPAFFFHIDWYLQRVITALNIYVIPIIVVVGMLGNTVSLLVYMCTPYLTRQSSSVYLAFLAAVSNGFLASLAVVWFGWVRIQLFHRHGLCQLTHYCTYVCSFLSVWSVVGFTFERWIIVFLPLRRHRLCTRRRAAIAVSVMTVVALAFYSFSIYTFAVSYAGDAPVCMSLMKSHLGYWKFITSVDTVATVIAPCVLIIVMNIGIGVKIYRYTERNRSLPTLQPHSASNPSGDNRHVLHSSAVRALPSDDVASYLDAEDVPSASNSRATTPAWRVLTRRRHTQYRVTRALLIVSSVFFLLNMPGHAFRVQAFVISVSGQSYKITPMMYIWQELLQFLHYVSFSANFFLYSAFSRHFRYAIKRIVRRTRKKLTKLLCHRLKTLNSSN